MIAATNPYQAQIDQLLKSYVQFYVVPRLRTGKISKADLDTARQMLDTPAIVRGYSQSAVTMIRGILDQLSPYAVTVRSLSGLGNGVYLGPGDIANGNGGGGFLDDVWSVFKDGVSWVYDAAGKIFTAGQTSVQVQTQGAQILGKVDTIISDFKLLVSNLATAMKGGAVGSGIAAFWNTTIGKVAIVGGGVLVFRMMSKR